MNLGHLLATVLGSAVHEAQQVGHPAAQDLNNLYHVLMGTPAPAPQHAPAFAPHTQGQIGFTQGPGQPFPETIHGGPPVQQLPAGTPNPQAFIAGRVSPFAASPLLYPTANQPMQGGWGQQAQGQGAYQQLQAPGSQDNPSLLNQNGGYYNPQSNNVRSNTFMGVR